MGYERGNNPSALGQLVETLGYKRDLVAVGVALG
jgi:hypothetical protein